MTTIVKEPGEIVRQQLTFGGVATIGALHSISSVARGLVPGAAALVVEPTLFAGALTIAMSGGSDGERYLVTIEADDAAAVRRTVEIDVAVLDQGWEMPDGGPPMLAISDFIRRFGIEEVVRMTDERGDGRVGKGLLVGALIDAQALVEAHVSARYQLPLESVPVVLQTAIADIARGRLYPGGAPEGAAGAAKAALRTLERVQSGQILLPSATPTSASGSEAPILFHTGGRAYRDDLSGF